MSEIQRYKMEFAPGSGGWIKQTARGELVLFTDHEAAIEKLNVEIAGKGREIARLDAALAEKQQVLADAKARIGRLAAPNGSYGEAEWGFLRGVTAALAALTQPQTERERFGSRPYTPEQREFMEKVVSERPPLPQPVFPLEDDGGGAAAEKCPEDCDGFGQLIGDSDGPCPACSGLESDGGGAATAAGVADADLEAAAMEISVKATRLDPETYKVPDKLIWMLRSALFPNEDMERIKSPGPYAKAFREKFPVPEFPGIKNRQEDQA